LDKVADVLRDLCTHEVTWAEIYKTYSSA